MQETAKRLEWRCQVKDCTFSSPPTLKGFNQIAGHQLHHSKEGVPKKERIFRLVDQGTGEVLAQTLTDAREKGLLQPEPEPAVKQATIVKPEPEPTEQQLQEAIQKYAEEKGITFEEAKTQLEAMVPEPEPEPQPEPEPEPEPRRIVLGGKVEEKGKRGEAKTQPSPDGVLTFNITLPADAFTFFNLAKACGLEKDADKPFDEFVWDCILKRFEKDYKVQLILAPLAAEEE